MDSSKKIEVRDLNLWIGTQQILRNVSLTIPRNQITVILGPSGCGKTSFLKTLNRLVDLNDKVKLTGEIRMEGTNLLDQQMDLTALRKKMGLLSQRPYPLPMSIFDNVAYGLRINGIKRKTELIPQVELFLRQASLWDEVKDRLKDPASLLSIGQQQRLCLARGLAVGPEIILADEPTSALDPLSSQAIESKFLELKSNYTIVWVTHILRQARRIADHVVFMYLGEVIEQGPADDFFGNPKMERTQAYLKGAFN